MDDLTVSMSISYLISLTYNDVHSLSRRFHEGDELHLVFRRTAAVNLVSVNCATAPWFIFGFANEWWLFRSNVVV